MRRFKFVPQLGARSVPDAICQFGFAIHEAMQIGGVQGEKPGGLCGQNGSRTPGLPERCDLTKEVTSSKPDFLVP